MGNTQATEFAGLVDEGAVELAVAVGWHLRSNHYPPHPSFMIPVALRAVELANDGLWDERIDLPENEGFKVEFRGSTTITVSDAVEAFHLDAFIASDQDI